MRHAPSAMKICMAPLLPHILQSAQKECSPKFAVSARLARGRRSPEYRPTYPPRDHRGHQDAELGCINQRALREGQVGDEQRHREPDPRPLSAGGLLVGEVLEGTYDLLHRPLSSYAHSAHYAPAGPKNRRLLLTRVRRRGVLGGPDATSCIILAHRAEFTYMLQPAAFYSRRHIVPFL